MGFMTILQHLGGRFHFLTESIVPRRRGLAGRQVDVRAGGDSEVLAPVGQHLSPSLGPP